MKIEISLELKISDINTAIHGLKAKSKIDNIISIDGKTIYFTKNNIVYKIFKYANDIYLSIYNSTYNRYYFKELLIKNIPADNFYAYNIDKIIEDRISNFINFIDNNILLARYLMKEDSDPYNLLDINKDEIEIHNNRVTFTSKYTVEARKLILNYLNKYFKKQFLRVKITEDNKIMLSDEPITIEPVSLKRIYRKLKRVYEKNYEKTFNLFTMKRYFPNKLEEYFAAANLTPRIYVKNSDIEINLIKD